jgi:hypothetical protein
MAIKSISSQLETQFQANHHFAALRRHKMREKLMSCEASDCLPVWQSNQFLLSLKRSFKLTIISPLCGDTKCEKN